MSEQRQPDPSLLLRVGGISALVAGALFFSTLVYTFGVMSVFGFNQEMFDDRALLLPWVADHAGLYRGLWLLYFASQVFLLPVPLALCALVRRDGARGAGIAASCAVAGVAAVVMAMVGLVVIYATSAPVARAFVETTYSSPSEQAGVLLLGDLFADIGKEVRLFSELLLGIWLGDAEHRRLHAVRGGSQDPGPAQPAGRFPGTVTGRRLRPNRSPAIPVTG